MGAFRLEPAGPARAYETFAVHTPRGPEHWRQATCEEVECQAYRHGWQTRVPIGSDLEATLRGARHRHPFVDARIEGAEWVFTFAAGTPCFQVSTHRVKLREDLPQLFVVRGGDWRGNPTGERRIHKRPEDWAEHLHERTDAVTEALQRG